ncbi:hypothetical protein RchiOBHm_Chr1g0323561 [Rosa chinensis]|uniref:Uncharacterized protein n=1 Tax=Rosa chinensis TaxID=74649 RepID=A0A2P6S9K4_ROSCH|nr:hypothetical protein RchiOBHm_Chr1g0323561 [Rosa chinensis]
MEFDYLITKKKLEEGKDFRWEEHYGGHGRREVESGGELGGDEREVVMGGYDEDARGRGKSE